MAFPFEADLDSLEEVEVGVGVPLSFGGGGGGGSLGRIGAPPALSLNDCEMPLRPRPEFLKASFTDGLEIMRILVVSLNRYGLLLSLFEPLDPEMEMSKKCSEYQTYKKSLVVGQLRSQKIIPF